MVCRHQHPTACRCLRTHRQRLPADQVPVDRQHGTLPQMPRAGIDGAWRLKALSCACRKGRRLGMRLTQALRRGHTGQP